MMKQVVERTWPLAIQMLSFKMDQTPRWTPVGVLVMWRLFNWVGAQASTLALNWPIGQVAIAWAFANPGEPFNRRRGLQIARGRVHALIEQRRGSGYLADYRPDQPITPHWETLLEGLVTRAQAWQGTEVPRYLGAIRSARQALAYGRGVGGPPPPAPPYPVGRPPGPGWEAWEQIQGAQDPGTELSHALKHWRAWRDPGLATLVLGSAPTSHAGPDY